MTMSSIIPSTLAAEEDVDEEKVPLIGAQQGLVLITTLEGKKIHWLGVQLLKNSF